jgi:hypothetical protein
MFSCAYKPRSCMACRCQPLSLLTSPVAVMAAVPLPSSRRRGGVRSTGGTKAAAAAAAAVALVAAEVGLPPAVPPLLLPAVALKAARPAEHTPLVEQLARAGTSLWHQRSGAAQRGTTTTIRRSGVAVLPAVSLAVYVSTYSRPPAGVLLLTVDQVVSTRAKLLLPQVRVLLSAGSTDSVELLPAGSQGFNQAGRLHSCMRVLGSTLLPSTLSYAVTPGSVYLLSSRTSW